MNTDPEQDLAAQGAKNSEVPPTLAINDTTKLWGVDLSWSRYRGNSNGDLAKSDQTKYHIDRGDSTAKCSRRIFLNSIDGTSPSGFGGAIYADQPAGTVGEMKTDSYFAETVCRRCVPKSYSPNGT